MNYEILPDGNLRLFCGEQEQASLKEMKIDYDGWGSNAMETDVLERLLSNSELQWIPEGVCMGDLTCAPMLGILGDEIMEGQGQEPECFGLLWSGPGLQHPVIARWAWMHYAVRSFLDDLAETGECVWEGGYADGSLPSPGTCEACDDRGWITADNSDHGFRIARCEACEKFSSDDAAVTHVVDMAAIAEDAKI